MDDQIRRSVDAQRVRAMDSLVVPAHVGSRLQAAFRRSGGA
jgi:hypothetical protein